MEGDYQVRIRERNGQYHAAIPELGLFVVAADAGEAWSILDRRVAEVFAAAREMGMVECLPPPQGHAGVAPGGRTGGGSALRELGLFSAKLAIVLALGGAAVAMGGRMVVAPAIAALQSGQNLVVDKLVGLRGQLSEQLHERFSVVDTVAKVRQHLDAMPPERKQALKDDLRAISAELGTFFDQERPVQTRPPRKN